MSEDREIHRTPFLLKEVTKIYLIADHFPSLSTVKHNLLRSTEAIRPITIAANHEQEENDHHGHLVHGEFLTIDAAAGGGTGRLLHLFR